MGTVAYNTPYRDLLPPLSREEYQALSADIQENGVHHVCFVDENRNVLDGHNRLDIDPDAPVKVIEGLSEAEKVAFVLSANFRRRNLSPEQKAEVRQRMKETAFRLREENKKRWTQARLAQSLGVDQATVSRWFDDEVSDMQTHNANNDARVSVPKEKRREVAERVDAGETHAQVAADLGISRSRVTQIAIQERKREENAAKVDAITSEAIKGTFDGLYDVLVIDPPWPMEKIEREVSPNQSAFDYPTMTEDELAAMTLPVKSDCHVWLWTTHKFLPMALRLLDVWGLKYVCSFVWHKPGGFQPFGLPQYNCEFALYARHGAPEFKSTKAFDVCFEAPRGKHSEKPEEFYATIRRVTDGRRLDIFSRREIDGFDRWGNEA